MTTISIIFHTHTHDMCQKRQATREIGEVRRAAPTATTDQRKEKSKNDEHANTSLDYNFMLCYCF